MQEQLHACLNLLDRIDEKIDASSRPVCAAGFDGFIDTLASPVMNAGAQRTHFQTIKQFGEYLADKGGKSGAIELDVKTRRAGGNAPIFSHALAALDVQVHCMAALGFPEPDPIFASIYENCDAYSHTAPGLCTALEFEDGKIFLTQNAGIRDISYRQVKQRIGATKILSIVSSSDAIAMLNWGEIENMHQVWQEALLDFSDVSDVNNRKKLLVDFADISARTETEIHAVLALLRNYKPWFETHISMNLNEFQILGRILAIEGELDALSMQALFQALGVDGLVVHTPRHSFFADVSGCLQIDNRHIAKPLINTGAGDHFNAGFMYALLHRFDMQSALIIAGAVSGFFVSHGFGPGRQQLREFLSDWQTGC